MEDPASYGSLERDVEQALIALKKGTQLVKYSRKAKPKVCPFRLSLDETTLIWISHKKERNLKLSSVSCIIPGQRTAVFRRYLQPKKDYLSLSLVYNNGERTLDLICKDKDEVEVWFTGLKTLISTGKRNYRHIGSELFDDGVDFIPNSHPFGATLEFAISIARNSVSFNFASRESSLNLVSTDVGLKHANNMQPRTSIGDGFRISVSSTPSCSSGGSGPDDIESLGDVYMWGEIWADGISPDGFCTQPPSTTDVLIPKPLETSVVLDVQQIASGVRHIALVTRQGEVFTWGEESGGRLGHGINRDFGRPQLVEVLAVTNMDFVACGENHTCAVSTSDDLFSWGDGTYNVGVLGHGTDVSHWIPKRVSCGPLEGLQVISIACGTWHSALATSNGKLFTFGDGTFGVLGHGNRMSVPYPKEVQLLSGLKTIKVACGVWHTAAIVEVTFQSGSNVSSRKLFTWGDGDKYRLGHGNKETYLQPTCVSTLIEYNFHQIACGHTMTIALTTSGHVFTMGHTENGQLGNPLADGKVPILVQDKLVGEFVEEISCGSHHVAALTSRSELFTWGKGANGRLGHGDIEDRKSPTLVESLKDRHVKNISCGSNFTSCICIHKWVSGVDQSVCTGCRQPFGFTRKRHNCYNCGLVHCHSCSSRKVLKAALAPTPGKPHRVCDSCYNKLKAVEAGTASNLNRKITSTAPRSSIDARERFGQGEIKSARLILPPITDPMKYHDTRSNKLGNKYDYSSLVLTSQVPSLLQLNDIAFGSSTNSNQNVLKPAIASSPQLILPLNSRPASPYARRPSPPRSSSTHGFSKSLVDSLRKTNEILNQEVSKLQNQVRSLKLRNEREIQKLQKNVTAASSLAVVESSKHREMKEFFESTVDQLKEMVEKLPQEVLDNENWKIMVTQAEDFLKENLDLEPPLVSSGMKSQQQNAPNTSYSGSSSSKLQEHRIEENNETVEVGPSSQDGGKVLQENSSLSNNEASVHSQNSESDSRSHDSSKPGKEGETQAIEQFEPGVYVTVIIKPGDVKIFKRVRFSKRRFREHQAEEWWNKNKDRVLRKYSPQVANSEGAESSNTQPPPPPPLPPTDENIETTSS